MRRDDHSSRERGSVMVLATVISLSFAFLLAFVLEQSHVQAVAARVELESVRALYDAYAELKTAQAVISEAGYDTSGRNEAIQAALMSADGLVPGTDVAITELTGSTGNWFSMTARIPYADHYERVVSRAVREVDYFSSYNLFVDKHPAGVSGQPVGDIHSNRSVQFYFPGGRYRDSVTAVEGFEHKAGATADNTRLEGAYDPHVEPIDIGSLKKDGTTTEEIREKTDSDFLFAADEDVRIKFFVSGGEQWLALERWTQPTTQTVRENVLVGHDQTNPREETYTYAERELVGHEPRERTRRVLDHYETVTKEVQQPVYEYEPYTETVLKKVWVENDGTSTQGGTTVGGDGDASGHYEWREVEVTRTRRIFKGYETVTKEVKQPVYTTITETVSAPVYQRVEKTATRTVYDQVPIHEERDVTHYIQPVRKSQESVRAPENGLLYAAGNITSIYGDIIDRLTLATQGTLTITKSLVYRDQDGDAAYLHGVEPWHAYEPNPDYNGNAALGLIASQDVLYSRHVPTRLEINASMMAVEGRVGIEGVKLDEEGNVVSYNEFTDLWGRPLTGKRFRKESLRRLGGITSALRPLDTVLDGGRIASGFDMGESVFDNSLIEAPPPFFLSQLRPRFFALTIEK